MPGFIRFGSHQSASNTNQLNIISARTRGGISTFGRKPPEISQPAVTVSKPYGTTSTVGTVINTSA